MTAPVLLLLGKAGERPYKVVDLGQINSEGEETFQATI